MPTPVLNLGDIPGDVLMGLQKDAESFVFFKIVDPPSFKLLIKQNIVRRITNTQQAKHREYVVQQSKRIGDRSVGVFQGVNLGLTTHGMNQVLGAGRPRLDPAFERGADDWATIDLLHDPPSSAWLK